MVEESYKRVGYLTAQGSSSVANKEGKFGQMDTWQLVRTSLESGTRCASWGRIFSQPTQGEWCL